jgi:PAS domain S-box-containing protein
MTTDPRQLGIGVGALEWGTHLCHFYETPGDLLDTLVPFFKAGLEHNEFCFWMASSVTVAESLSAVRQAIPEVDAYISAGRLEIATAPECFLEDRMFAPRRIIDAVHQKLEDALARGYVGMRISGVADWLDDRYWLDFRAYERALNESIAGRPLMVLCSYSLPTTGAIQMLDVAQSHQFVLARRRGAWELLETLELKRSQEDARYRELFESSHEIILILDPAGHIVDVNRRGQEATGYSRAALLSMNLPHDLVRPDDRPIVTRMIEDVQQGNTCQFEVRLTTRDGSEITLEGASVPRFGLAGEFHAIFCTLRDVTEQRGAELALRERVESAREDERTRIARELHDELGSALTSVKWDLEALERACAAPERLGTGDLSARFAAASGMVDATIETVRRIASELRPSILDDLGLIAAVEWQAQQFEEGTGIPCRVDALLNEEDAPDGEQATAIFRILQETLTNVRRHAAATRVSILLEQRGDEFVLEVRDNGVGIAAGAARASTSLGLMGIRERASLLGGRAEIGTAGPRGTVVTVHVPTRRILRQES